MIIAFLLFLLEIAFADSICYMSTGLGNRKRLGKYSGTLLLPLRTAMTASFDA
jgi:hypothetical protein